MKSAYFKFSLTQKLVAGYALMLFFTLTAAVFAIAGLYSLNLTAKEIASNDLVVINSTIKLREILLAQERFAGRYIILKSPEFLDLYTKREKEFLQILGELAQQPDRQGLGQLTERYRIYQKAVAARFKADGDNLQTSRKAAEQVTSAIDSFYEYRQRLLHEKLEAGDQKEKATVRMTLILTFSGFLVAVAIAAFFTYNITMTIRKLKRATHRIAEGDFDYDPLIPAGDEIGDLAQDFTRMAKKLKELEQMCLDASPLTRLPGNIAIERVLNRNLHDNQPFAVCYADLDNFKAYNDRYGYIKASEMIKLTGEIIERAVRQHGDDNSFVGHVGGDDFVMVVSTAQAEKVCAETIKVFDETIVNHYSPEDLERGAIEGVDRYGVSRVFPIMTISIAVLICRKGEYDSAADIGKTAADIKDYLKGLPGSNFFINRRKKMR